MQIKFSELDIKIIMTNILKEIKDKPENFGGKV